VLQQITAQPLDRDELFCLWPFGKPSNDAKFNRDDENDRIYFDPVRDRLMRRPERRGTPVKFTLQTTALANHEQVQLTPCEGPVDIDPLLELPDLPELTRVADQWVNASGLDPDDTMALAEHLEWQLAESGQFQYSLQGQNRDPEKDAVEDFVAKNRSGHCEYFATALALMLRSRDIPSRVVLGYRCDEWSEVGKFHRVRQLHAHAWVEAFVARRHLPLQLLGSREGRLRWRHGAWLRLDGTPAASIGSTAAESSAWGRWQRRAAWLQSLWEDYVVEMDRQRQRETVFQPLRGLLRNLSDPQWWSEVFHSLADSLRLSRWSSLGAWLLGVVLPLCAGLAALAGMAWALLRAGQKLWRRWKARSAARVPRSHIQFYRRWENLLARWGLTRKPGQTPRELAIVACKRLARQSQEKGLAALPLTVVEAFYHVRFGGQTLDEARSAAVDRAIQELEDTP
jgi:hypothetical protein